MGKQLAASSHEGGAGPNFLPGRKPNIYGQFAKVRKVEAVNDDLKGQTDDVLIRQENGVVWITLNRPNRRNALTVAMMESMRTAIEDAQSDTRCRAIVLTGAGDKSFCAGADLVSSDTPFKPEFTEVSLPFARLLRAAHHSQLPIICGVNGTCLAGGMGFLGVSDIVIAADTAKFGMPEVKVGLFPMQIVAVLQHIISERDMIELCITGRIFDAREANQLRFVNKVVEFDQLPAALEETLQQVQQASPMAIKRGKYSLRAMAGMTFEQKIAFAETMVGPMIMTKDAKEGISAFTEKRKPRW